MSNYIYKLLELFIITLKVMYTIICQHDVCLKYLIKIIPLDLLQHRHILFVMHTVTSLEHLFYPSYIDNCHLGILNILRMFGSSLHPVVCRRVHFAYL
jgi:hypothetical protein